MARIELDASSQQADRFPLPLDLVDPLKPALEAKGIDALLGSNHHSPESNWVTAELKKRGMLR